MSVQAYDLRLFGFSVLTGRCPRLLWLPTKLGFALGLGDPIQVKLTFFVKLQCSDELCLFVNLEHSVAPFDKCDDVILCKFKEIRQPKTSGSLELFTDSVSVDLAFVIDNRPDTFQNEVSPFN